jgi:hypothetical protein
MFLPEDGNHESIRLRAEATIFRLKAEATI